MNLARVPFGSRGAQETNARRRCGFAWSGYGEPVDTLNPKQLERLREAAALLNRVSGKLPLLRSMDWDDSFRQRYLADGTLPTPVYHPVDIEPAKEGLALARRLLDPANGAGGLSSEHPVTAWLLRLCDTFEHMTGLLKTRGTPAFFQHSTALFGEPGQLMIDRSTRVLDLARHMDESLADLDAARLVLGAEPTPFAAVTFADRLRPLLTEHFGERAPTVFVDANLSAKALAGSRRIRVREGAMFTARDVQQLLQHEALVHTATALNGRAHPHFNILGRAHAGATEIQEGLAVFAEMISGAMDPARFRRLADRVLAIQMCIDGADFREVYEFYRPRCLDEDQAYENTRRIFRGGVIGGGAPFTKDMVYLNGLLRVHNYLRSVVKLGRADLIRLLFCGKMDLEDIPAIACLASGGELAPPAFMPPWAKDLRFLVSYLAYSSFLNRVKMPGFQSYYQEALAEVPDAWSFFPAEDADDPAKTSSLGGTV